jgi:hypothetical protein
MVRDGLILHAARQQGHQGCIPRFELLASIPAGGLRLDRNGLLPHELEEHRQGS